MINEINLPPLPHHPEPRTMAWTKLEEQAIRDAQIAAVEKDRAERVSVPDVDTLTDKIASLLGSTYHCTRVWSAWNVGTMSQDDFYPVDESDTPRKIAEELHAILTASTKMSHKNDQS